MVKKFTRADVEPTYEAFQQAAVEVMGMSLQLTPGIKNLAIMCNSMRDWITQVEAKWSKELQDE